MHVWDWTAICAQFSRKSIAVETNGQARARKAELSKNTKARLEKELVGLLCCGIEDQQRLNNNPIQLNNFKGQQAESDKALRDQIETF